MKGIAVQIQYRKYKLSLKLEDKITIICGDSATGKSTIHKVLNVNSATKVIKVSDSSYKLRYIGTSDMLDMTIQTGMFPEYNIYIFDEGQIVITDSLARMIQESKNCYFIIVMRSKVGKLNFGLTAVKQLVSDNNKITRAKTIIEINKLAIEDLRTREIGECIIEDSGKAKQWFEALFSNLSFPITTPNAGKEQICALAEQLLKTKRPNAGILLIFDECSFGVCYKQLKAILDSRTKYNDVLILSNYKSWEYLMLNSNFYKEAFIEYSIEQPIFEEKFYEIQLDKLSSSSGSHTRISHNSSTKLPKCYTEECCAYKHISNRQCRIGLSETDKFVAMLQGTIFEDLLIIARRS